ncbi:MAG: hypothetical protein AB7O80_17340 [Acetobacteraceae bacterium]
MTTRPDSLGLPVAHATDTALAVIDRFTHRLLRLAPGVEAILDDVPACPDTPMVRLLAAALCLFGQTGASDAAAADHLAAARPMLDHDRERQLFHLLTLWARQDHLGAATVAEAMTQADPRDLLAAKLAEFFYYVLGQQHEGPRFLAHMQRLAPANGRQPDFLSMLAFAHELTGDLANAERWAEAALAETPDHPWVHHCIAHQYLRQGNIEHGIARLQAFLPLWPAAGRFIHCHNAWHLAVAYLEALDPADALALYRQHVGGVSTGLVAEQLDSIAFLWRAEMAGADHQEGWDTLADLAETQVGLRYMPFMDAHTAYALARAGRRDAVAALLAGVEARAGAGDAEAGRSWRPVGLPLVRAAAALAQGDAAGAAGMLDPAMAGITVVGGSDAQVDLFRQAYHHALSRAGRHADARAYWQAITAGRDLTPLDRQRLGGYRA